MVQCVVVCCSATGDSSLTLSGTFSQTHTHTHTLSLFVSLSLAHTHSPSLSLSFPHPPSLFLSPAHYHTYTAAAESQDTLLKLLFTENTLLASENTLLASELHHSHHHPTPQPTQASATATAQQKQSQSHSSAAAAPVTAPPSTSTLWVAAEAKGGGVHVDGDEATSVPISKQGEDSKGEYSEGGDSEILEFSGHSAPIPHPWSVGTIGRRMEVPLGVCGRIAGGGQGGCGSDTLHVMYNDNRYFSDRDDACVTPHAWQACMSKWDTKHASHRPFWDASRATTQEKPAFGTGSRLERGDEIMQCWNALFAAKNTAAPHTCYAHVRRDQMWSLVASSQKYTRQQGAAAQVSLHELDRCNTLQHNATHCNTLQHTAHRYHCTTWIVCDIHVHVHNATQ